MNKNSNETYWIEISTESYGHPLGLRRLTDHQLNILIQNTFGGKDIEGQRCQYNMITRKWVSADE